MERDRRGTFLLSVFWTNGAPYSCSDTLLLPSNFRGQRWLNALRHWSGVTYNSCSDAKPRNTLAGTLVRSLDDISLQVEHDVFTVGANKTRGWWLGGRQKCRRHRRPGVEIYCVGTLASVTVRSARVDYQLHKCRGVR